MNEMVAIALALPLVLLVEPIGRTIYSRLRTYATARCVTCISDMLVATDEPSDEEIRALRWRYPVGIVFDSVRFVSERVYGGALNRLALIIEVCELDYRMLDKIGRKEGAHRSSAFWELLSLPYAAAVVEYAENFSVEDEKSDFYAMATLVSAHPERAVQYIAEYTAPLSLHEVAVLTIFLRRAGTAIAYTPLLTSSNRNLQMVGIYLSHHFSIVDAEPHLQRLAESDDCEIAYLSLQTLCSIRGDISAPHVGVAFSRLQPHQRNAFILRAVQCCYSLSSCAHYLTRDERTEFSQRVSSYKCRIVCN